SLAQFVAPPSQGRVRTGQPKPPPSWPTGVSNSAGTGGSARPIVNVVGVAPDLVAGVAERVSKVVARVGDLVRQALVAVGLAPRLLGLVVDVAERFLGVGLHVFVTHGSSLRGLAA